MHIVKNYLFYHLNKNNSLYNDFMVGFVGILCLLFKKTNKANSFVYVTMYTRGWKVDKESYTIDENLKN